MFTSEERCTVRDRLLERAQGDEKIIAAALTGSGSRGAEDRWSDVDLYFGVAVGTAREDALDEWSSFLYRELGALHHFDLDVGYAIYRGFLLLGGLEVDIAFAAAKPLGSAGTAVSPVFGTVVEQPTARELDREGIGLPPRPVRSPAGQTEPLSAEQLATAASERLLRFVGDGVVGMVVGMVTGDREMIVSRGPASRDGVFDIGSITKLFTALLLADMVSQGEVGLDDPLERFLPTGVRAPRWQGRDITLVDLATHTSGLPRLPRNLLVRATLHRSDPYRGYTVPKLHRGLAATRLRRAPGAGYRYSNFGFAVLGHALASAAGVTYEELVVDRVCRPLGWGETMFEMKADVASRRETGHAAAGQPVPDWDLAAFTPAGGLSSTVVDMLRFLRANLDPGRTNLAVALEQAQRPRRSIGAHEDVGLGWQLREEGATTIAWHNGGTGGFGGFVAMLRELGAGVAVLYNSPPSPAVDAAVFGLLSDMLG